MPNRQVIIQDNGPRLILIDSITQIEASDQGSIVITGSHGGMSVVDYVKPHTLRAVFFNDAGIGKDQAGIVALKAFEERGLPAAAYSHMSARIGDAVDGWQNGIISHINPSARNLGLMPAQSLKDAIDMISKLSP